MDLNWIKCLTNVVDHIEKHLTEDIDIEKAADKAFASSSHFQFVFHVVMGVTIGEYIRNRRLSLAAQDLLSQNEKVIEIAARYKYETPESFSKAFTRFHGVPPSKARRSNVKLFYPLSINISVQGGFDMSRKLIDEFLPLDLNGTDGKDASAEAYKKLTSWAAKARGRNPGVFDALTEWILDDAKWCGEFLKENEWILMQGVLARFKEQNAKLRTLLKELEPSGVVNEAVFKALDRFDSELSGNTTEPSLREAVGKMFNDFSAMKERGLREIIAGQPTGQYGTIAVDLFGYINLLKDCDAGVQWALFMPDFAENQQKDFRLENFEYREMPAIRFIGFEGEEYNDEGARVEKMRVLDGMKDYKSDFDFDLLFMHHYGKGVEDEPWHGVWGRFMRAETSVPEGFVSIDLTPKPDMNQSGPPYISRFAFATFYGDMDALHSFEGYDSNAIYDVTRNIILGQGVQIPYPNKYWTAEVHFDGCDKESTGCLFSVAE